jgi:hypothetical protein
MGTFQIFDALIAINEEDGGIWVVDNGSDCAWFNFEAPDELEASHKYNVVRKYRA